MVGLRIAYAPVWGLEGFLERIGGVRWSGRKAVLPLRRWRSERREGVFWGLRRGLFNPLNIFRTFWHVFWPKGQSRRQYITRARGHYIVAGWAVPSAADPSRQEKWMCLDVLEFTHFLSAEVRRTRMDKG